MRILMRLRTIWYNQHMQEYPMNLQELKKEFATEKQCLDYIYQIRWPDGFCCPKCKYSVPPIHVDKTKHKYKCRICYSQTSVTSRTLFEDTQYKLLPIWFQAIWYVTSEEEGISALGLQKKLGLGSYHTALNWVRRIRNVMRNSQNDEFNDVAAIDKQNSENRFFQFMRTAIQVMSTRHYEYVEPFIRDRWKESYSYYIDKKLRKKILK